jgi:hypothetical protein
MIHFARISSAFRPSLAICLCVAMGFPVASQACSQWDVSGQWTAVQSNGAKPNFSLQQSGSGLQGRANDVYVHKDACVLVACGDDYYNRPASADGAINGDSIELKAYWDNNTIGVYSGTIGPQGRIEGTTYDQRHPESRAEWYSDRTMKCLSDEPASGVSPPSTASPGAGKPVVALGRVQSGADAPAVQRIGDEPPICANARSARARNSPVAPALEAQCRAAGGSLADRSVTPMPSTANESIASRPGLLAASPAEPSRQQPPPPSAAQPANGGHVFAPPLFDDGARLWACAGAKDNLKACSGVRAGRVFCRTHGFSGGLQKNADGSQGLRLEAVRVGLPVRDIDGNACKAADCVALAELHCEP